ncbi:hypothetical protein SacmaDRAFT_2158 [Saccharomonospora marina XMU15]|uniref:Uncharacterized protein n=1 Tax=Saccharomonospora marina XMU15 TaxID=882083 RepID=H5XAI2_9PSEU|nr:hypothetical protein [Saccharomonospora marina]EHR50412.1 hypothetical protein SacmaDRAFT_2158 [Saccharomonospora marina XMU15]
MASSRRDFSELNAKLERQLQRLPDPVRQRAQDKLQKYVPPALQPQRDEQTGTPGGRPSLSSELAVVSEIRDKWTRWNEPAAKLQRRKRRTSRALTLWVVLVLLSVLYAAGGYAGIVGGQAGLEGAFGGIIAMVLFGALAVRSGARLVRLNRTELPQSTPPPKLPPASSAAREPMERLAESEASLAELLKQLTTPPHGVSAAVPELSVQDARATADEAAKALRALAARMQSIERGRESAPAAERAALDSAVRTLRTQLDDGLDGYGTLVAAAGRAVAESSGGVSQAKDALTDATDRLAGLALALRDLSS